MKANNKTFLLTIVSVSLNEEILHEMDKLQKALGFSGRSEIIRAGIRNLLSEEKKRQDLIGLLNALFLVIHDEESDEENYYAHECMRLVLCNRL